MAETPNLNLYLEDDPSTKFKTWREKMDGGSDSNMVKIDRAFGKKADTSRPVSAVLLASGWSDTTPPQQTIAVPGMSDEQNGTISVAQSATVEQRNAARNGMFFITAQMNQELTIVADGEKPKVDVPVTVILLG